LGGLHSRMLSGLFASPTAPSIAPVGIILLLFAGAACCCSPLVALAGEGAQLFAGIFVLFFSGVGVPSCVAPCCSELSCFANNPHFQASNQISFSIRAFCESLSAVPILLPMLLQLFAMLFRNRPPWKDSGSAFPARNSTAGTSSEGTFFLSRCLGFSPSHILHSQVTFSSTEG